MGERERERERERFFNHLKFTKDRYLKINVTCLQYNLKYLFLFFISIIFANNWDLLNMLLVIFYLLSVCRKWGEIPPENIDNVRKISFLFYNQLPYIAFIQNIFTEFPLFFHFSRVLVELIYFDLIFGVSAIFQLYHGNQF